MTLTIDIAAYLTIWWTTLFAILPLGVRSHHEEGIPVPGGGDPASPVDPKLKRKFLTTTWVAAIPFALLWLTVHFHWVTLPSFQSVR
jgi:predicted secreted protein